MNMTFGYQNDVAIQCRMTYEAHFIHGDNINMMAGALMDAIKEIERLHKIANPQFAPNDPNRPNQTVAPK